MKPFDPKTAKNGDVCYGTLSKAEFIYIGPTPVRGHEEFVIIYDVENEIYKTILYCNLRLKPTKRTVWINVFSGFEGATCYMYSTEDRASKRAAKDSRYFVGTYPLEIEE